MAGEPLPTGVDVLDKRLGGGIPAGSLVAYVAPPSAQSELFLYRLARQRETVYVSTMRNEQLVADTLGSVGLDLDAVEVTYAPPDMALEVASETALDAGPTTNIVVDTADILEEYDRHRYQRFLNQLLIHLRTTDGIAVFHCYDHGEPPANRALTESMAELVVEVHRLTEGSEVETYFGVPRFQTGEALTELIKVELTDEVSVDTSRNIS